MPVKTVLAKPTVLEIAPLTLNALRTPATISGAERDDGEGIPLDKKRSIFEMKGGARVHESATGSLGLGLPLARTLARKLGGDIVEIGKPGTGAQFLLFFKNRI